MAEFPLWQGSRSQQIGLGSSTQGTLLAASATANTKGSWTELVASTDFDASTVTLILVANTGARNYLVDFGIGGSGSETVLIPDVLVCNGNDIVVSMRLPLAVPGGSRLSARCQSTTGSSNIRVGMHLVGGGLTAHQPCSAVEALGADVSDSSGASVDAGASANAKGAWVSLGTLTRDTRALGIAIGVQANPGVGSSGYFFDLGAGASGSQSIAVADAYCRASAGSRLTPPGLGAYPCDVPAGVELWARSQSGTNDVTDRVMDVVAYAVS